MAENFKIWPCEWYASVHPSCCPVFFFSAALLLPYGQLFANSWIMNAKNYYCLYSWTVHVYRPSSATPEASPRNPADRAIHAAEASRLRAQRFLNQHLCTVGRAPETLTVVVAVAVCVCDIRIHSRAELAAASHLLTLVSRRRHCVRFRAALPTRLSCNTLYCLCNNGAFPCGERSCRWSLVISCQVKPLDAAELNVYSVPAAVPPRATAGT